MQQSSFQGDIYLGYIKLTLADNPDLSIFPMQGWFKKLATMRMNFRNANGNQVTEQDTYT